MAQSQMMTGPGGDLVKAFRRGARNVQAGDWLPELGAYAAGEPVTDPEAGRVWITTTDGVDFECTPRGKVWLWRQYAAPAWMAAAVAAYRDARDAREALRESDRPAPAGVAGTSGAVVACYQLERDTFEVVFPAPRLADFIREAAAAHREEVAA